MDGTLTVATDEGQSGPGSNVNERVLYIYKAPELEPQYQMQFTIRPRTLVGVGVLQSLQRCSRSILQAQLTRPTYLIKWWNQEDKITVSLKGLYILMSTHTHTYTYIYVCMCVCVCVYVEAFVV